MSMFRGSKVPEVSAVDAENGSVPQILLDVRNADEWEAGHAPNARWIPLADLESFACALEESLAEPLRRADPPVIGIVRDGLLLLDCRTLADDEVEEAARAVNECRSQ